MLACYLCATWSGWLALDGALPQLSACSLSLYKSDSKGCREPLLCQILYASTRLAEVGFSTVLPQDRLLMWLI